MGERWREPDQEPTSRVRVWTAAEKAERHQIIRALVEALALPTRQLDYGRLAQHLGSDRTDLMEKMLRYGIPCPVLARDLTPDQHERIAKIKNTDGESDEQLALAVTAFLREAFSVP
jgi:hypothetical protein